MSGWLIIIVLAIITIVAIILVVSLSQPQPSGNWKQFTRRKLGEIDTHTDLKDVRSLRTCVVELDSLLDHTFKNKGVRGETMGERLKSARGMIDKGLYNRIWEAHKVRNRIVHEPDFAPSLETLKTSRQDLKESILALL